MPKRPTNPKESIPEGLKPYRFHGLDYSYNPSNEDATADCVMCGADGGKFSINATKSTYQCWACKATGNGLSFIRWLWEESDKSTQPASYALLAEQRCLLLPETVMQWGAAVSVLTGEWLLPSYKAPNSRVSQLHRYAKSPKSDKQILLATPKPTCYLQLFGLHLYEASKRIVCLCEGPWDAMALYEVFGKVKPVDDGIKATANLNECLLTDTNILAVPGSSVFKNEWCQWFAGKTVYLLYDSDHPVTDAKTSKTREPAGLAGMRKAADILANSEDPPEAISYLHWGAEGYDPDRSSGYDVRDFLIKG